MPRRSRTSCSDVVSWRAFARGSRGRSPASITAWQENAQSGGKLIVESATSMPLEYDAVAGAVTGGWCGAGQTQSPDVEQGESRQRAHGLESRADREHQASCSSTERSHGGTFIDSSSPLMRTGTSRISPRSRSSAVAGSPPAPLQIAMSWPDADLRSRRFERLLGLPDGERSVRVPHQRDRVRRRHCEPTGNARPGRRPESTRGRPMPN